MITFCPKCGTKLGGDESVVGKQVQCGKCGNRFTAIPADLPSSREAPEEKFPEAPPPPSSPPDPTGGAKQPVRAAGSEPADEPTTEGPAEAPPVPATAETPKPKPAIKKAAGGEGSKCPKCNAELLPNAVLCTKCGTFLKQTDAAATQAHPAAQAKSATGLVGRHTDCAAPGRVHPGQSRSDAAFFAGY